MSELIDRKLTLRKGITYSVEGFRKKIDLVRIDFIGRGGVDQNDDLTLEDVNKISNKIFGDKKVKVRAHSACGIELSVREGVDDRDEIQ